MRIVIGHIVLWITLVLSFMMSFNDYRYPNAINWVMLLWTLVLSAMGIWTIKSPKPAFVSILISYLATAVYRYLILDGEILFYFLVHIIFITSMILAVWSAFSKGEKK